MSSHIFSLYVHSFFKNMPTVGHAVIIDDFDLMHRMIKVLRFNVAESVIFFDTQFHALIKIIEISKKSVIVQIQSINKNYQHKTNITFLLPLLKRDDLESAVYSLCELSVDQIALVITEKSRRNLINEKEFTRLTNVVIAAAEQSKNYAMSRLLAPQNLQEFVPSCSFDQKIMFDISGKSFFEIRPNPIKKLEKIVLLVGPEAGLTDAELHMLKQHQFQACILTQSTVRAVQAVALGAGLFRIE